MIILTSDMEACSFQNWYPVFKEHTTTSVVIPLSDSVVNYLLEDSTLVLPEEVSSNTSLHDVFDGEAGDDDDDDDSLPEVKQPSFPAFSKELKDGINELDGAVFIKLNWSAPLDASWITSTKTLKCTSIEDIYLLLKSSDLLVKDLTYSMQQQSPRGLNCCVVLRKWQDIEPGNEFRCFVCKQQLIAISQRDYKVYYPHLAQRKYELIEEISKFFKDNICEKFPVQNYTFDIVRYSTGRIEIIDFNPFDHKRTLPLLFTWGDLCAKERDLSSGSPTVEFRILGEDPGILPNPHAHYGIPQDFLNLRISESNSSVMDNIIEEVAVQREHEDINGTS